MKNLIAIIIVLACAFLFFGYQQDSAPVQPTAIVSEPVSDSVLADAFASHQTDIQVSGKGIVKKLLRQDNNGSRHQKFIIQLSSGQTLLVSHNIDLAPAISNIKQGDMVEFFGEYEWNPNGGVIHWTHLDPQGKHVAGWIRHKGKTYQ